MTLEIRNAKIASVWLGFEDHGILSSYVMLQWQGSGQGFGGYVLTGQYMATWVARILKTVGVERWEDLKGKPVRIEQDWNKITRLGNFIEDSWFDPETEFKALEKKELVK